MVNSQARFEQLMKRPRERQWRLTPQRVALPLLLASSQGHPSAAQLCDRLRAQFPTTSLATVHKTLSLLDEMDKVLELRFPNDVACYDGKRPYPYPHLICIRYRKIVHVDASLPDNLAEQVAQHSDSK